MAHNLGIQVTAEWIENKEQLATIRSLGCDYAQGYLISPALPADKFAEFLNEWTLSQLASDAA
jgi:EAL domain-containing protein (putative c-di-GMP-specific phosphodiesterase class I)